MNNYVKIHLDAKPVNTFDLISKWVTDRKYSFIGILLCFCGFGGWYYKQLVVQLKQRTSFPAELWKNYVEFNSIENILKIFSEAFVLPNHYFIPSDSFDIVMKASGTGDWIDFEMEFENIYDINLSSCAEISEKSEFNIDITMGDLIVILLNIIKKKQGK